MSQLQFAPRRVQIRDCRVSRRERPAPYLQDSLWGKHPSFPPQLSSCQIHVGSDPLNPRTSDRHLFTCFFTFSLRLVNISQNFFFLLWSVMTNGDDLSRPGKGQTLVWISILWRYKSCPQKKEEFLSVSLRNWGRATKESRRDFLLSVVDSSPSPSVFEFSIVDKSITSRTRDTATTVRERFLVLILPSSA